MKKKSASQSAFFNLRVLIGLFIVVAGVFLALAGLGTFSSVFAQGKSPKQPHVAARQDAPDNPAIGSNALFTYRNGDFGGNTATWFQCTV